jgi:predicted PurR-regulated permease PerM
MLKWLATFILIWFVYEVRHVFPPIIVGAIIAYLLLPIVKNLSARANVSMGISTAIVYMSLIAVLGGAIWWLGPPIFHELSELAGQRREIVQHAVTQFAQSTNWDGDVNQATDQIMNGIAETIGKPGELAHIGGMVSHGFLSILVCFVSSIYLTVDSSSVGKFFLRFLPVDRRQEAIVLTGQMNTLLSKYVQGQVLLIVLMSSVAWVFLALIMKMKFALPVAIFSGFLEIIPVLGPILAITVATLVGVWQFGPEAAAIIIIFYTIARWIEDYVVVPKVIGHAVDLHPLAVIFAVLCGEHMAGGLGMLIAIPVAACIKLIIDFFYFGKVVPDPLDPDLQDPLIQGPDSKTRPSLAQEVKAKITQGGGVSEVPDPDTKIDLSKNAEEPEPINVKKPAEAAPSEHHGAP